MELETALSKCSGIIFRFEKSSSSSKNRGQNCTARLREAKRVLARDTKRFENRRVPKIGIPLSIVLHLAGLARTVGFIVRFDWCARGVRHPTQTCS